jgi:hypothetical protein
MIRVDNLNLSPRQDFTKSNKASNKEDFSATLTDTLKTSGKEALDKSLNQIKDMGNILISTQSYSDVLRYKNMIKSFLSEVLEYGYSLNKRGSFWEGQYFSTVELIDEKLDSLTKEVLANHEENISIASSIEEIQGLLIDVYC